MRCCFGLKSVISLNHEAVRDSRCFSILQEGGVFLYNDKSLKNLEKGVRITEDTAAEYGRRGSYARSESKRRNAELKEIARTIGAVPVPEGKVKDRLLKSDVGTIDPDWNVAVVAGVRARAAAGDVNAARLWEEWIDAGMIQDGVQFDTALATMRARFWDNISSNYAEITVAALKHKYTHYDAYGGRGSGKSSWASLIGIRLIMEHPDIHGLVMRKVANTLRDSVFAQYRWAIGVLGVEDYWDEKKSPLELIYRPTGQKIMFRGTDDPLKLKSIKVPFGYLGFTHFEEKDQFAGREELRNVLQSTMRGGSVFWNIETYNPPISRDNWANLDSAEERPDRISHHSTYLELDNPEWLGEQFLNEAAILKERDERAWMHEYGGIAVGTGGNVFENIETRNITEEQVRSFDRIYQGADWGFFPDPFAFIRLHYDKARETIWLIDELVVNKWPNESTGNWIRERGYNDTIVTCDSAEPKSITDYRAMGINAKAAVKGPGSVDYGMKWLQKRTIVVDRQRTPHAYEELVSYCYEKDRNGEWISGYPDENNHVLDAMRYALERVMRARETNA